MAKEVLKQSCTNASPNDETLMVVSWLYKP